MTTIYVTHDQVEAMTMGDRVAVMRKGELQQVAEPAGALRPAGQPLRRRLHRLACDEHGRGDARARSNGHLAATTGSHAIALDDETIATRPALESYVGSDVILGIRPEDLEDAALVPDTPGRPASHGNRPACASRSARRSWCTSRSTRRPALTEDVRELAQDMDAVAIQSLDDDADKTTFVGRFNARSRVREGEVAEVAVDTRTLHFFDPETGLGIYDTTRPKEVA